MNCLMVVHSYHHGNTRKIAQAMAAVLDAEIKTVSETGPDEPGQYSLVGFGAGIDSGHHYGELLAFADRLPACHGTPCFIFSTSGVYGENKMAKDHLRLREKLLEKGYEVIGEFSCAGYNTNRFLKYFGGMNKGRPDERDLQNARQFAKRLNLK